LGQESEDLEYENLTLSRNILGLILPEEEEDQAKGLNFTTAVTPFVCDFVITNHIER
jgi:hypothetical protein